MQAKAYRKIELSIFLISMLAALIIFFPKAAFSTNEKGINWEADWQTVLKQAAAGSQPILIDFYTDWCPHCKRLDEATFTDPTLIAYFSKMNYRLLKINPEKDNPAEEYFKVYCYPTLVIYNAKGVEIDRILGFRSPGDLIKILDDLGKGIGTLTDLLHKVTLIEDIPQKIGLMFEIIDKYTARADFKLGLEMADQVMQLDAENQQGKAAEALLRKGYIYYKWKKYDQAADVLLSIHQRFPNSDLGEDAYQAAAYYARKGGDKTRSLAILKDFLKQFPNSPQIERTQKMIQELENQ